MNELVSVIMPSYNTAEYISDSIKSVLAQTYGELELIIVDDCSSDGTEDIVSSFDDERIRFFKNEKNLGAALCRNRALREARGKWIAFLDSDDIWLPEKLGRQIAFMKENGYAFSYTNYAEINASGQDLGVTVTGPEKISRKGAFRYCWQGCLTVMYDAEKIGLVQVADIKKNNDYAMWLKISKSAECRLLPETLAKYRRGRTGSVSTQSIFTMMKWHYRLFRYAEGESVFPSVFHTCGNMFFGFIKKIFYVRRVR